MGRRIVVLLVAVFAAATAFSATAAPLFFHMVDGICTDSSVGGDGQPLCYGHTKTMVKMVDGYVPGTPISNDLSVAIIPVNVPVKSNS